ncbi:MAG: PAS domain S-box protein, partial [Syntrophales bacterium]
GQVDEPAIRIVISDITVGQKLKEANIHLESSRYAESIVETVREPLLVLDPDLKIISANHSFYRSFQVDPAETIGSFIYDLGNGQWDIPSLRELLETILPQKTTFDDYEVEHDFTTIGKRTMLLNARQIQGVLGKDRIILLAIEDITELKLKEANNLLEKMVEERTKQLRRESEAPPAEGADTILLVDDDPHILAALNYCLRNTAYEVLTADGGIQALEIMETTKIKVIVSDEQMEGMSGSELLAEVRQRSPHTLRILLTGHATLEMAMRAVNEGGVYRFFTKPWNNALLRLALFAATEKYNFDAERRRLQDVLRQTEEHYRTVVEFSPHAVLVHRDGTIIYANPAAIRMFGATSLQDLTADPFIDRIHPDYHQIVLERLQKIVIERVSTPIIELKYIRLDGTIITVEAQGTPIIFDGLPSIHSAILDITDRKRTEEALQLLRNGLEHLVAERTEELRRTNEELTTEITAHKLTEEALTDQSRELEETNTALHVLLRRREGDLRQSEQKIVANLQKLVLPYIGELKQLRLSPDQSNRVEIIDANLQHVISPFLQNLTARYSTFTPREIQVANLIVEGKTSKEIAVLVNSAHRSVEFHRNNIRKKLGLQGKVTNLRSFLLTLS